VAPGAYGPYNPCTPPPQGYGDGALAVGSDPASGTIAGGETKTIIYEYKKLPLTAAITVEHRAFDAGFAPQTTTHTVPPGVYGPYNPLTPPPSGYGDGVLASYSAPASGTVAAGDAITITYLYSREVNANITVIHIDWSLGKILAMESFSIRPGHYGPYQPKDFDGYDVGKLNSGSDPAEGDVGSGGSKTIIYEYVKTKPVTGTVRIIHRTFEMQILEEEEHIVPVGHYGPYAFKEFITDDGKSYIYVGLDAESDDLEGEIGKDEVITIIFRYFPPS
jgi:hypothetical protein